MKPDGFQRFDGAPVALHGAELVMPRMMEAREIAFKPACPVCGQDVVIIPSPAKNRATYKCFVCLRTWPDGKPIRAREE